jgi:PAS domain-containing protein
VNPTGDLIISTSAGWSTPDGVIKHIHSVGHAILNESGELVQFIGSTVDITERKRAEERAQSHNEAVRLALNSFVEELDLNRFLGHVITGLAKQFQATASELWLFEDTSGMAKLFMTCEQGKVVRVTTSSRGRLHQGF